MLTNADRKQMFKPPRDTSDGAVRRFIKDLDYALKNNSDVIVLDCSQLQQVNSSHINALWQAWRLCNEAGREIKLHDPSPGLVRVLKVLDLHDLLFAQPGDLRSSRPVPFEIGDEQKENHFRDSFTASRKHINNAQDRFHQFLASLSADEIMIFELTTVFYEVTTNIRLHGRLRRKDLIEFKASYLSGVVSMEFVDPGQPFDILDVPCEFDPNDVIAEKKTHGFGLIMINRLTDSISYKRKQNQYNVLTLKKKRR